MAMYFPQLASQPKRLLALCGCSDEDKARALAACRVKAVDAVGPRPPPCIEYKDEHETYSACVKRSADKITAWEYQYPHTSMTA